MRKIALSKNHPDIAGSYHNIGNFHLRQGNCTEALKHYQKGLRLREKILGNQHPSVATSYHNLGNVYHRQNKNGKALDCFQKALAIFRRYFKESHPNIQRVQMTIAMLKATQNMFGNSQSFLTRQHIARLQKQPQCIEALNKIFSSITTDKVMTATECDKIGAYCLAAKDYEKAQANYKRALTLRQELHGDQGHVDIGKSYSNLGHLEAVQEHYDRAAEYYEQAFAIYDTCLGEEASATLEAAASLEKIHMVLEPSYQTRDVVYDDNASATAWQAYQQGHTCAGQGDYNEAIKHYEQALKELPEYSGDTRRSICHNLGCMYHVSALAACAKGEVARNQEDLKKAQAAFEQGIKALPAVKAGLWVEYTNFLLSTDQLKEGYLYLLQAIKSEDANSGLSYGALEQAAVSPVLQKLIDQNKEISLRSIDYAQYLLIHHYEAFRKAGIELELSQATYLEACKKAVDAVAGQKGQEQADAVAYHLLGSLYQEVGDEAAAKQAFAQAEQYRSATNMVTSEEKLQDESEASSAEDTEAKAVSAKESDVKADHHENTDSAPSSSDLGPQGTECTTCNVSCTVQ